MEMDSAELDHDRQCIDDTLADQLLCPGSPEISGIFGDPQVLPRVGDQYQVEIPPLMTESDHLQPKKNPADAEVMVDIAHSFVMGLPIPVMWVHDKVDNIKLEPLECLSVPDDTADTNGSRKSENNKERQINSNNENLKLEVEPLDVAPVYGKEVGGSASLEPMVVIDQMDMDWPVTQQKNSTLDQMYVGKSYCPVPGSLGDSWNDIEKESFILGLYIFGKNLIQVKSFVESKEMGDILSFYHGEFYRSDGHRKWSECRKMKSRRCIHGQRIFSGWRQQELLSRLLPRVSEEYQNTLLELSRTFGEGKISLEEYVSTLKATVGLNILIEAVGIGKGKQDLTGIVMEPIKTNQIISTRPELPIGKACSSLTSSDIIKFLTGDFRLSKARSNDLFWEAVWPRLLARGWHSEQPKNHGYAGSKHPLVFLVPGVKKFSRRRHVKGNHYFDSVSDVLSKVASDPTLLELEVETVKGSGGKEEYGWDVEMKSHQDGLSDHQRRCYLRPRFSNCNSDLMKFTIVDTSLVQGEKPFKVRELRSLPVDTTNTSTPTSISRETVGYSSEENVDEPDSAHMFSKDQGNASTSSSPKGMFNKGLCSELSDSIISNSKHGIQTDVPDPSCVPLENHESLHANMSNEKHSRKTIKCQFNRRVKNGQSNYLAPVTKRRRLTACGHAEKSCSMNNFSVGYLVPKQQELCFQSNAPDAGENMVSQVGRSLDKLSSTCSSAKGSPDESSECIVGENRFNRDMPHETPQPRTLIDLNLPHVPPDSETVEPFIIEVADSQDDPSAKRSSFPSETSQQPEDFEALRTSSGVGSAEQQPTMNARRQSTRNRPLTMKALEALACGFLNTKRRRRGTEVSSQETSISRPSRRARGGVGVAANYGGVGTGVVDSKVKEGAVDGECSSNLNMLCNSQNQSEKKGTLELLGFPKPAYHPEILMSKDHRSG